MRTTSISKDTALCISLASRPSSIGTRFHNYLYEELDLDFVYKAFTTTDLPGAVAGIRALGIRGCGVSMPFKEAVIDLVDTLDDSAEAIGSVNTVVNEAGQLHAYNTDVTAVQALVGQCGLSGADPVAVLGSGGMARAVTAALVRLGLTRGTVVSRNEAAGRALAQRYGYHWSASVEGVTPRAVLNATPVGMAGGPDADRSPVPEHVVAAADVVLDAVAAPEATPLVRAARRAGARVITGAQVMALQAAEQFTLYTGVRPTDEQVSRARAFSRGQG